MGNKKRGKYTVKIRPQNHYGPVVAKKKGISTGMKVLIGLALIAVIVVIIIVLVVVLLKRPRK